MCLFYCLRLHACVKGVKGERLSLLILRQAVCEPRRIRKVQLQVKKPKIHFLVTLSQQSSPTNRWTTRPCPCRPIRAFLSATIRTATTCAWKPFDSQNLSLGNRWTARVLSPATIRTATTFPLQPFDIQNLSLGNRWTARVLSPATIRAATNCPWQLSSSMCLLLGSREQKRPWRTRASV